MFNRIIQVLQQSLTDCWLDTLHETKIVVNGLSQNITSTEKLLIFQAHFDPVFVCFYF